MDHCLLWISTIDYLTPSLVTTTKAMSLAINMQQSKSLLPRNSLGEFNHYSMKMGSLFH